MRVHFPSAQVAESRRAIHPAPQPEQLVHEQPLVELLARLLATVLNAELKTVNERRQAVSPGPA